MKSSSVSSPFSHAKHLQLKGKFQAVLALYFGEPDSNVKEPNSYIEVATPFQSDR